MQLRWSDISCVLLLDWSNANFEDEISLRRGECNTQEFSKGSKAIYPRAKMKLLEVLGLSLIS